MHTIIYCWGNFNIRDIDKQLKGKIPKVTIKQALSRLAVLKLIERIGLGRSTRYKKRERI